MRIHGRQSLVRLMGIALFSGACAHEAATPTASDPARPVQAEKQTEAMECGEYKVDAQNYFLRLLDEKGEPLNSPDLLVDIERRYDFYHNDPAIQDVDAVGKSCLKIEKGWATAYFFDESHHQARVARFADMKPGTITDLRIESVSEKQMTYEFRECEQLTVLDSMKKPMIYDLFDASGQPLAKTFKAVFQTGSSKRELLLSAGSCVVLDARETGRIIASDGRDAYIFPVTGRGGENDRYLRIISKKKERFADHAALFPALSVKK